MALKFPSNVRLTPDVLKHLSIAVGGIVLAWGSADAALTATVTVIFQHGGNKHKSEIPVAMKNRFQFTKLCLRKLTPLAHLKDAGLALMADAKSLSKTRDAIVHGFLSNVSDNLDFTFTNLKSNGQDGLVAQASYSYSNLLEVGNASMDIATRLADFAKSVTDALMGQDPVDNGGSGLIV